MDREEQQAGSEALSEALALSFRWLRRALLVLAALYLLSGVFVVRQHEQGFVLLFGRLQGQGEARIKRPGLHWTLPKPFSQIIKVQAERVHTVATEPVPSPQPTPDPAAEPSPWDRPWLTGDANLLLAQWVLRYTIADAQAWQFQFADPAAQLRDELHRAVVESCARTPIDRALYTEVDGLRAAVEQRVRDRCRAMGLGVRVERVDVIGLQPPPPVAEAFAAVVQAEQDRSRLMLEAKSYAARRVNEAAGEASRLRAQAGAAREQWVSAASADAAYFEKIHAKYLAHPAIVKQTLRQDALRRALQKAEGVYFLHEPADGGAQELRLWLSPPRRYLPGEAPKAGDVP